MDLEWSKTTEEKATVKDASAESARIITGQNGITVDAGNSAEETDNKEHPITSTEQVLTLMGIYQSEWAHYDDIVWKHAFTHFGFILAVILFPFVTPWLRKPEIVNLPYFIYGFPVAGFILAAILLCVMLGYDRRMRCSSSKYRDLIENLPLNYQEERLNKNDRSSITKVVAIIMFVFLLLIAVLAITFIPCWRETISNA